jgi:hypothetical protein
LKSLIFIFIIYLEFIDISNNNISNEDISKIFPILLGPIFRLKYGVHLYNPGPDSPPQALGDERTELFPLVRLG